ncbi:MAG: hypothetical protein ACXAEU_15745 [Candidatus Hodarchaeales archaeon]
MVDSRIEGQLDGLDQREHGNQSANPARKTVKNQQAPRDEKRVDSNRHEKRLPSWLVALIRCRGTERWRKVISTELL